MTVTFTGLSSVLDRTIFTKKGPIVKRPLELLTGSNLTVVSETEIVVPTGPFLQSHVGKNIEISGSPSDRNDGTFAIERVISATKVALVKASFNVVDEDATVARIVSLANDLKAKLNRHMVEGSVHYTADTSHPVTALPAYNLASSIALLNNIRTQFESHIASIGPGPVHAVEDEAAKPFAKVAHDLASALILANELAYLYRIHRENKDVHNKPDQVNRLISQSVDAVRNSGPLVGPFNWRLLDLRQGQIADDPDDVTVTVNGSPASVDAVIGLLGAVVLSAKPDGGDTVLVDYDYLTNPPVQIQRLNSPEFTLNQVGNRGIAGLPGHKYRARAYLPKPSQINSLVKSPVTPKRVGWKYKAFQRAHTAVLNDPNTLLLNVPTNRITNPVLDARVKDVTLRYDPTSLPHFASDPWTLKGSGTFKLVPGGSQLTIEDSSDSSGANSDPPFFCHDVDLSYPNSVMSAFRMSAESSFADGVFVGPSFGFADGQKIAVAGLLLTEATNLSSAIAMANDIRAKYSAHLILTGSHVPNDASNSVLLNPARDLPSLLILLAHLKSVYNSHIVSSSHRNNDSTNAQSAADPKTLSDAIQFVNSLKSKFDSHRIAEDVHYADDEVNSVSKVRQIGLLKSSTFQDQSSWACEAVDWSQMTTYRLQRTADGDVSLFVGGNPHPAAYLESEDLPSSSDVDIRLDSFNQVFFGSVGKISKSISKWSFLRANVTPTQERQIGDNKSVVYSPSTTPELDAVSPWMTVGQSGHERISSGKLLLDSTASARSTDVEDLGQITGAYRGFVRYEPSLTRTSTCAFEFTGSVTFSSFSVDNRAAGVFLDDGSLSTHLVYIESSPTPASTVSTRSEPFPISGGETLIISVNGDQPATATFPSPITSGADVAAVINGTASMPAASVANGHIALTDSSSVGANSKFQIIGGSAAEKLGIQVGTYLGKDSNVGPRISWFGAYLPNEENPPWSVSGNQAAQLKSRVLHIEDSSTSDYKVYTYSDPLYTKNVLDSDWKLDLRASVSSYTAGDAVLTGSSLKFCGVLCNIDEGPAGKNVEIHFSVSSAGDPYINVLSFDWSTEELVSVAEFPFVWNDKSVHSVNLFVNKTSDLCLVLADGIALGTFAYTALKVGVAGPAVTFGSGSQQIDNADLRTAKSSVDWHSVSLFVGVNPSADAPSRRYVGLYKGGDPSLLSSYYLHQIDWSVNHTYRLVRDPQGSVSVYIDGASTPSISTNYDSLSLPPSGSSFLGRMTGMKNTVSFGSFSPYEISRTSWSGVRYSVGELSLNDRKIVGRPVNNQAHVISSPEHLRSSTPHTHSNTRVYSSGTPTDDFMASVDLVAHTVLGDGTPPVPMTQDLQARGGFYKVATTVSVPDAEDLVNVKGFLTDLEDDSVNTLTVVPDSTAPYDLDVCKNVLNELSTKFNRHLSQYRVHVTNDVNNSVTAAAASSLPTAILLANNIKECFNSHREGFILDGQIHTTNDSTNEILSPNASDLTTLGVLCLELSTKYSSHLSQPGVHGSSVFIRLEAPDRVLYDRMKFFITEEGESGLLSPFSDDETDDLISDSEDSESEEPSGVDPDAEGIAWTGSWGFDYSTGAWDGRDSDGTSGSHDAAVHGGVTSVAINGHDVPSLNGTSGYFTPSGKLSDYIDAATGECSGVIAFRANTLDSYLISWLFSADTWGIHVSNSGVVFRTVTQGGGNMTVSAPVTAGALTVALFRYVDDNLEISTDYGETWNEGEAIWGVSDVDAANKDVYIGKNGSIYFDGAVADYHISDVAYTREQLVSFGMFVASILGA